MGRHRNMAILQAREAFDRSANVIEQFSTGAKRVEESVIARVARLARGFPQFAHALGLYSAFSAIEAGRNTVMDDDVIVATKTTVHKLNSLDCDYKKATASPHSENIFSRVLRACALAKADELDFFRRRSSACP